MNTRIISAFPGVGKTYLYNNQEKYGITVLDSDSSNFSWLDKGMGIRHSDFPHNYIDHIKENIGKVDVILISSHDLVRTMLKIHELHYEIVCPDKSDKEHYISRLIKRGSPESLINTIACYWDIWLDEIRAEDFPVQHILPPQGYLSDLFKMDCNSP